MTACFGNRTLIRLWRINQDAKSMVMKNAIRKQVLKERKNLVKLVTGKMWSAFRLPPANSILPALVRSVKSFRNNLAISVAGFYYFL